MSTPQTEQPSLVGALIGGLFRLIFKGIKKLFRSFGITLSWLIVGWMSSGTGIDKLPYVVYVAAILSMILALTPKWPRVQKFGRLIAPGFGDAARAGKRKARAYGVQLCEWFGLSSAEEAHTYDPVARTTVIGGSPATIWTFRNLGVGWDSKRVTDVLTDNTHVIGASHVEVEEVSRNSWRAVFINGTPPALPAATYDPQLVQDQAPKLVCIGTRQAFDLTDGYHLAPALLALTGGHTLLVGSSGSGKGSVLWSTILGLSEQIKDGSVKVWGIDLKGGMEFGFGAGIFDRLAYTLDDADVLIDDMLEGLERRKKWMLDNANRSHTPTPEAPLYLLMIDEAAAFQQLMDSKRLGAFMGKLKAVLAQGRAAGYLVFAALQDPTKESFPARDLFTRQAVLRLRSEDQTRLALALGAGEPVPPAHLIAPSEPGVGFIRDSETGDTFKFRAFYVSDDVIQGAAAAFEQTPTASE